MLQCRKIDVTAAVDPPPPSSSFFPRDSVIHDMADYPPSVFSFSQSCTFHVSLVSGFAKNFFLQKSEITMEAGG